MSNLSRRDVLRVSAHLAALIGVSAVFRPRVAEAVEALASGAAPVLWLQAQSCSGCSVTTLNAVDPGPLELLTQTIALRFNSTLSAATGEKAMASINDTIKAGGFYLVVEGTIPAGMPKACVVGHEPIGDQVARAAVAAKAVIALGTCAAFGGVPAAENNPTGAVSVFQYFRDKGIKTPTISIPGCPPHPDWLVGTLVHLLKFGMPQLDPRSRPVAFFKKPVHDQCPRFADYEREQFAKHFGDEGCLFKLGCLGPITRADCTVRGWHSGANSCIRAGAPCVGCAAPEFAAKASLPFYPLQELAAAKPQSHGRDAK